MHRTPNRLGLGWLLTLAACLCLPVRAMLPQPTTEGISPIVSGGLEIIVFADTWRVGWPDVTAGNPAVGGVRVGIR